MSLDLLAGVTDERAKALLAELTLDQLCGLLFAKARIEKQRVDIRVRPLEARVRVKKPLFPEPSLARVRVKTKGARP